MDVAVIIDVCDKYHDSIAMLDVDSSYIPRTINKFTIIAMELHRYNYLIWHEEDVARREYVNSDNLAHVKRSIDKYNQQRNDAIERMDEWLLRNCYGELLEKNLPVRTETPGSVFDRLSILSLKIFHMHEQTERTDVAQEHIDLCKNKLSTLRQQQKDLLCALSDMLTDLNNGKIRMQIYRQFKMYNDPNLNPQLYNK